MIYSEKLKRCFAYDENIYNAAPVAESLITLSDKLTWEIFCREAESMCKSNLVLIAHEEIKSKIPTWLPIRYSLKLVTNVDMSSSHDSGTVSIRAYMVFDKDSNE